MKQLLLYLVLFLPARFLSAQNTLFLTQGRIEFEKKLNLYAQIDAQNSNDNDEAWKELRKKTLPPFKTTFFNLYFRDHQTLYAPGRDNDENNKLWEQPAETNIVYHHLEKGESVSQKNMFEQLFLIKDSTRQIKWKITDEMRNIAGFECRRANAIILDSIYVVAFYTNAIVTPGGPESFTGLPGMILGIAMPHEHVTWFATKVYAQEVKDNNLQPPVKGKKQNNQQLLETMNSSLKDWGQYARIYILAMML